MNPIRNLSIATLLLGALLSQSAISQTAQNYPSKPVKIVTPFPTGSGPDSILRVVSDRLSKMWGKPVVVENKPGASGFIAIEAVKRAANDGHELIQLDNFQMAAQPFLFKKLPYELFKDFEPAAPIFKNYFFVTAPSTSPWKTVGDLIASAKSKPNALEYGSWFVGSPGHIGGAMMEGATGTKMLHVPYKEMSQLYAAVGNTEVSWAFGSAASSGAMLRAGKIKYLAVAAPKRVEGFLDIPTVAEAGGPADFELSAWVALLAPKGTPKDIIEKIQKDVAIALTDPEVKTRLATVTFEPYVLNSEQFVARVNSDAKQFGESIKRLNISLD